jgi:hypothetical protein
VGGQAYLAKRNGARVSMDRLLHPGGWGIRNFKGRQGLERNCFLGSVDRVSGNEYQAGKEEMVPALLVYTVSFSPKRRRDQTELRRGWNSILAFVGFFAVVSYHTPYSRPWIWPPIALYAFE